MLKGDTLILYSSCDCDFQLQSIGDVPVDNLKISTKELPCELHTCTYRFDLQCSAYDCQGCDNVVTTSCLGDG